MNSDPVVTVVPNKPSGVRYGSSPYLGDPVTLQQSQTASLVSFLLRCHQEGVALGSFKSITTTCPHGLASTCRVTGGIDGSQALTFLIPPCCSILDSTPFSQSDTHTSQDGGHGNDDS